MSETTPWFDGDVRPSRPGIYQRRLQSGGFVVYAMWDGRSWKAYCANVVDAAWRGRDKSMIQLDRAVRWRGLTFHEYKRRGGK